MLTSVIAYVAIVPTRTRGVIYLIRNPFATAAKTRRCMAHFTECPLHVAVTRLVLAPLSVFEWYGYHRKPNVNQTSLTSTSLNRRRGFPQNTGKAKQSWVTFSQGRSDLGWCRGISCLQSSLLHLRHGWMMGCWTRESR